MPFRTRGTRRAGRHALLWCALLWGAAETGGALAPPCADATPFLTVTTTSIKPVGDPDTPDEGGNKNNVTSAGGATTFVAIRTTPAAGRSSQRTFWEWLRSLMNLLKD